MKKAIVFFCLLVLLVLLETVSASELVYRPISPSFGGDPLNGSFLLNSAAAQNKHQEKIDRQTPLEQFRDSLQRNLLSAISMKFVQDMYGESGLKPGHYAYGGMLVDVVGDASGITVTITDTINGGTTTVTVPKF